MKSNVYWHRVYECNSTKSCKELYGDIVADENLSEGDRYDILAAVMYKWQLFLSKSTKWRNDYGE